MVYDKPKISYARKQESDLRMIRTHQNNIGPVWQSSWSNPGQSVLLSNEKINYYWYNTDKFSNASCLIREEDADYIPYNSTSIKH